MSEDNSFIWSDPAFSVALLDISVHASQCTQSLQIIPTHHFIIKIFVTEEQIQELYCQAPVQVHTIPYLKESQRISENL